MESLDPSRAGLWGPGDGAVTDIRRVRSHRGETVRYLRSAARQYRPVRRPASGERPLFRGTPWADRTPLHSRAYRPQGIGHRRCRGFETRGTKAASRFSRRASRTTTSEGPTPTAVVP